MDLLAVLPAFLVAVVVVSATPGPAVALILRRAAIHGGRATFPLILGLETALFAWAVMAAVGLAALVAVSEVAFTVLRVVGAVVLIGLGVLALRAGWRARREGRRHDPGQPLPAPRPLSARRAFVEGLVTNLANPKAAVFMIAFFPAFIPSGYPVLPTTLALASLQVVVETCLYLGLAGGVARAGRAFGSSKVRARLEAISGTVLVGLGVRVAAQARP